MLCFCVQVRWPRYRKHRWSSAGRLFSVCVRVCICTEVICESVAFVCVCARVLLSAFLGDIVCVCARSAVLFLKFELVVVAACAKHLMPVPKTNVYAYQHVIRS